MWMMSRESESTGSATLTTRRTARILLVDDRERVLLFRCRLDAHLEDRGHMWITPGGGVQPGETLAEAAVRELREETGLSLAEAELGPVVARSTGEWGSRRRYLAVDAFFHVRVPALTVDTAGFQPEEHRVLSAHHWWSRSEIDTAAELVLPIGLRPLLDRLLAGQRPHPPVELPWPTPDQLGA
jgi:8-oxo-dGTP pyrophosphatase MutT (NUDIX family)